METTPRKFEMPFVKKEKISNDTYSFYFDKDPSYDFIPGQYNRVTLNIDNPDDRGSSRYFTIAASPSDPYLIITTRIIKSSFKLKLNSLAAGEKVVFFGPLGNFVLNEKDRSPKVLLAGGIGITPYYSIIKYADYRKFDIPITLFASFSEREDVIFVDEFKEIVKRNHNIKIIYTITHEAGESWDGETGRISEEMIKKHVPDITGAMFYIVGPQVMVEAMEELVKNMGVLDEKILKENFPGY